MAKGWSGTVSCHAQQKVGRGTAWSHVQHGKRSRGVLHVVMHIKKKVGMGTAWFHAQHGKRLGGELHVVKLSMVKDREGYCMLSCTAW